MVAQSVCCSLRTGAGREVRLRLLLCGLHPSQQTPTPGSLSYDRPAPGPPNSPTHRLFLPRRVVACTTPNPMPSSTRKIIVPSQNPIFLVWGPEIGFLGGQPSPRRERDEVGCCVLAICGCNLNSKQKKGVANAHRAQTRGGPWHLYGRPKRKCTAEPQQPFPYSRGTGLPGSFSASIRRR